MTTSEHRLLYVLFCIFYIFFVQIVSITSDLLFLYGIEGREVGNCN